ncbi:probable long-chain-alcohol O-fatty-acyltransferase 5 [Rutidosis leptorrhynchoides]|uniref:probable long-chain-alcohol O-fatty-acyltransferase 5 n=1 Tax=Rutidosis leptorrhynchoides TaxID=125765 RepID=UPI003A99149D
MATVAKNFIFYISTITISLSYCYFISSKFPKGIYRFISLIPIFFIFTILPLSCSFVFTTAIAFSFTTWLTNFKLIRFAFDLDQSPYHPSMSLDKFIIYTSLPIKSKNSQISSPKNSRFKFVFQSIIFTLLVRIVLYCKGRVHPNFISFIYGWLLFLQIDIVVSMLNFVLHVLTGLELQQPSNQPYLATSLQDFWGRWNLLVNHAMRYTVYKPVVYILSNYEWAPLAGVLASFFISGLMHELYVYQLARVAPTWHMTSFFILHGICVVVEMIIKRSLRGKGLRVPDIVATLLMNVFVVVTGVWLFVPPFIIGRIDVEFLKDYTSVADFIMNKLLIDQYA